MRLYAGIALSVCLVLGLQALPAAADSVFGLSYFGRELSAGDARIEGRAGMGLAYTDSMNAAVLHAAQLADLKRVTIGLTSRFEVGTAEDASASVRRTRMSTPVIRIGFPLPGDGGIGFGFSAQRSTQWTVDRPFLGQADLREQIEREGTLFDIPVQLGYRVMDHLSLGAGLHFRRGAVRVRYNVGNYDELNERISSFLQQEIREDVYRGWTPELSFGVHEVGPLSAAGFWSPEYDADVDASQHTLSDPGDNFVRRKDTMPARWGGGVRFQLPGRFSAGADYIFEGWSEYQGRKFTYDGNGAFDPDGTATALQDETVLRIGLERESERVGLRYTLPIRLGWYMRDWHYQVAGENLTSWGVTLGSGLALRGGLSRIDFSAGYSKTGDRDRNGVQETLWTIAVSVAGGERWY